MTAPISRCVVAVLLTLAPFPSGAQVRNAPPVTDSMLRDPAPADWLMWRRSYDSHGYSPLRGINTSNVHRITMQWAHGLVAGRNETTPLTYAGVMYIAHPADVIEALDAATGVLLWRYKRELPDSLDIYSPIGDVKRNIAIYQDLVISTSWDQFVFALDAKTGRLVWETRVRDYRLGGIQTSGPIVVNGLAVSGRNCQPPGNADSCVITAHDAKTGAEVWRTRTVPRPGEPADSSWGGVPEERRLQVGAWMVPSYDPELNLIYIGTSVTAPTPKFLLAGYHRQYLYHNSTLALDPASGNIVWYYQHLVDEWDLDHVFERMLVDTRVAPDPAHVAWINPRVKHGERRLVITGIPGKTGIVYTLDRRTGEFLWATPTLDQNIISSIDGSTGRVTTNPEVVFDSLGHQVRICPSLRGGRQWEPGAYSPATRTMFFPLMNTCGSMQAMAPPRGDQMAWLRLGPVTIPPGKTLGVLKAISVETGRVLWEHETVHAPGALLATAGGLLFGGDHGGYFRAFDQRTGAVLWEINLGAPVVGPPIAFAVGGREFIAVSTGAKFQTSILLGLVDRRNRSGRGYREPYANMLFVFAVPRAGNHPRN